MSVASIFLELLCVPFTDAAEHRTADAATPLVLGIEVERIALESENAVYVNFDARLKIHFLNKSSRPVLLFDGHGYPLLVSVDLARSSEDALARRYLLLSSALPSLDQPAWSGVIKDLDRATPPEVLVRAIPPGASWDFEKEVVIGIERNGSLDKTSLPWSEIRQINPLWLQVQFMVWPNNLDHDLAKPKFGVRLSKRWEAKGQLVIDDILSEPIPINLADLATKPQN